MAVVPEYIAHSFGGQAGFRFNGCHVVAVEAVEHSAPAETVSAHAVESYVVADVDIGWQFALLSATDYLSCIDLGWLAIVESEKAVHPYFPDAAR